MNIVLSNFYLIDIEYEGKIYPSCEHLYQSLRYLNTYPNYAEIIRTTRTPYAARLLGEQKISSNSNKKCLIPLDTIIRHYQNLGLPKYEPNIALMRIALQEKFKHELCRNVLLSTEGPLTCYDYDGTKHSSKLLTTLRDQLRDQ